MPQIAVAALAAYAGSTVATAIGVSTLVGAQVGWVVGSTLGGMLFGPKPEDGPRITDGKFASGAYGQNIPISYGTIRHKAQVVWFSGLHEHKDEVGGNSIADGADVYTYTCDLLVSACEGPQDAVLRIWANGRLIWSNNGLIGDADEEVISASNVRIYLGGEDQEPDPLYEADVGTENAVAYRGQVTVMLEGMQLGFAGNRPPVIEVEVTSDALTVACPLDPFAIAPVRQSGLYLGSNTVWSQGSNAAAYSAAAQEYYVVTDGADKLTRQIEVYSTAGSEPQFKRAIALEGWRPGPSNGTNSTTTCGLAFDPENSLLRVAAGFSANIGWSYPDAPAEYVIDLSGSLHPSYDYLSNTFAYAFNGAKSSGMYSIYPTNNGEAGWWAHGSGVIGVSTGRMANVSDESGVSYGHYSFSSDRYNTTADVIYVPLKSGVLGGRNFAWRWSEWSGYEDNDGVLTEIAGTDAADASRWTALVYAPSRKKVYVVAGSGGIAVINLDASSGSATALSRDLTAYPEEMTAPTTGTPFIVWNNAADALMRGVVNGDKTYMTLLDPDTMTVLAECVYDNAELIRAPRDLGDGRFVCILGDDQVAIVRMPGGLTTGNPITLQEIVEDVCERAGLPAENLDASAGTDLVDGYKIATQSTARAAIDNLRPGYFFDMPESGLKLVLKKRGGAAVATIDDGELGAHLFQVTQSDPTPPYELEHVQEIEVPRTVEVVYIDAAQDYDQGVQRASRQVGSSLAPLRIDVPVSMSVDKAQQVAWTNLLLAHASKSGVKLSLSHAYMALDAADPINVPLSGGEVQRIRIERVTRARPLLEVEAVLEDAEVYTQTMTGGAPEQGPQQGTPVALSDTVLALIDTSPLRDEDDALAVYAAMGRDVRAEAWSGGVAYKSVDGGSNWDPLYSTASSATIGQTIGGLDDFTGGNVWDEDSSVSIVLSSGTLSSATDAGVLNGMNALAIQSGDDWEIVQFVNAELIATNTWRISRLLRGRRGTERAISGHAPLDRVVLLTASSLRLLSYGLGEVGVERDFLAVTSGQALADGVQQAKTMNGNTIRPLSPVQIEGTRDSGDLTIAWVRRARLSSEWLDLYDVPLDEPTESYEIDILDGEDVVRTLTASTTTAEYTAAQQTSDFGSPQSSVDVAIYQISSRIGRGHAGTATL